MTYRPPLAMQPGGPLGRPFAWLMERMNRPSYAATLGALAPQPGETLLEIGYGTGAFLALAAQRMAHGVLAGVDPSPLMTEMARRTLAPFHETFTIDLRTGTDAEVPTAPGSVHRVAAIHSFQFWPDPQSTLATPLTVLPEGGVLCLTLRRHGDAPPGWLPNPISRMPDEPGATRALLQSIGFSEIEPYFRTNGSAGLRAVR